MIMSLLTASFSSEVAMVMVLVMDTDVSDANIVLAEIELPLTFPMLPCSVLPVVQRDES